MGALNRPGQTSLSGHVWLFEEVAEKSICLILCSFCASGRLLCKKKKKKLRGTASDSPLELLQKYSYVHAPLGAEDGDLQTDKCDQPISSLDNFTFGSNSFF